MSDWPQFDDTAKRFGRAVLIRSAEDAIVAARAAFELGVGVALISEPGAAVYGGPALFTAMRAHASEAVGLAPEPALILDVADDAAKAYACLGDALEALVFTGSAAYFRKLGPLARARGILMLDARPPHLDLDLVRNQGDALRKWLTLP